MVALSFPVAAASVANNPPGVVAADVVVVVNPPAVVIISDPFPAAVPVTSVCMLSFSLFTVGKKKDRISDKQKQSFSFNNKRSKRSASRS